MRFARFAETAAPAPVTISERQLKFHKTTEALSVFVAVPFLLYLASRKQLPGWARLGAVAFAGASLYIDGGLLATWAAKAKGEKGMLGSADCGCGCNGAPGGCGG